MGCKEIDYLIIQGPCQEKLNVKMSITSSERYDDESQLSFDNTRISIRAKAWLRLEVYVIVAIPT